MKYRTYTWTSTYEHGIRILSYTIIRGGEIEYSRFFLHTRNVYFNSLFNPIDN